MEALSNLYLREICVVFTYFLAPRHTSGLLARRMSSAPARLQSLLQPHTCALWQQDACLRLQQGTYLLLQQDAQKLQNTKNDTKQAQIQRNRLKIGSPEAERRDLFKYIC